VREAIKVPCEPKTAFAKAMWIAKHVVSCEVRNRSLDSASCEAKIVPDCKTISALHRAKPRLSREVRAKALCVNSEATAAPLTSSALLGSVRLAASDKTKALSAKDLNREVKNEAPLSANSEATSTSLTGRTPRNKAKLAIKGSAKTGEATLSGEAILDSAIAQKKVFKAKPRVSQPKQANIQFPRVSVLDQLDPGNANLRDYLSNK